MIVLPKMEYTIIAEKYEVLEKKCKENAEQIKEKENLIYSLNQKIERVLLLNDNFGQDQKIVSEFTRASKLTILSQINTMIIDVCMSQISEKFNDFSDKIQEKVSNLEEQMKDLQFSLLCKGKSTRSNSIDNKLDKKRQEKIYEKLEESIFSKIQVLNEELEYKFTNKLFTSLEKEIESLKKEIHTQNNESIQLKANINTSNKNSKHERKQSASNIFSDIFTWKKSNSVTLNNLIHDENNAKFNEVFGSDCKEISKKFDSMIEEMKIYFKDNDIKVKKSLESSERQKEDINKIKIVLQDYDQYNHATKDKVSRIKDDCEKAIKDLWDEVINLNNKL